MMYDINNKKTREIKFKIQDDGFVRYSLLSNGFTYYDEKNSGFYNMDTNTIMYKNEYDTLFPIENTKYLICNKDGKRVDIVNTETGKVIITRTMDAEYTFGAVEYVRNNEDGYFVTYLYVSEGGGESSGYNYVIYDENIKLAAKLENNQHYKFDDFDGLAIYKKRENYSA